MTRKPKPFPPDLSVDDQRNWDFYDVTPEERAPCCQWEYARESAYIRGLIRDHPGTVLDPKWPSSEKELYDFLRSSRTTFRLLLSFARFVAADFHRPSSSKCFPQPWQSLSKRERRGRILFQDRRPEPVEPGQWFDLREVVARAANYLQKAQVAPDDFCGQGVRLIPPLLIRDEGVEIAIFRIHWRNYNNEQIADAFTKWIHSRKRPNCFRLRPGRPPKSFNSEAALEGLAIMRLLHHYKPSELNADASRFRVWKRCSGRQLHIRKEAVKRFQAMFPFGELPLSSGTAGGRSR